MTQTVKMQRAYVTRRSDPDNSLWVQEEAERLALIEGDAEEALRRRNAAQDLKRKLNRSKVTAIPFHIIRELGSRDAIGNMLKARQLEERHGRTVLRLRDYMVARQVSMGAGGNLVFVEGGQSGGIESKIHALRQASAAIDAGERTLPGVEYAKPVTGLVCGHVSMRQASGQLKGRTAQVESTLRGVLRNYLEAAEPFFGGFA